MWKRFFRTSSGRVPHFGRWSRPTFTLVAVVGTSFTDPLSSATDPTSTASTPPPIPLRAPFDSSQPLKLQEWVRWYAPSGEAKWSSTDRFRDFVNKLPSKSDDLYSRLTAVADALEPLDDMVGLAHVKKTIIGLVVMALMGYHLRRNGETHAGSLMNMVLVGPPGSGKSTLAAALAALFFPLGVCDQPTVHVYSRGDLVAGHVGGTAINTRTKLEQGKGGIIILDEFQAFFETSDISYANEAIAEMLLFMTENPTTIIIICGYEDKITQIFQTQPGLGRRFPFWIALPQYTNEELCEMFLKMCKEHDFDLSEEALAGLPRFIKENRRYFPESGGSLAPFLLKVKLMFGQNMTHKLGAPLRKFELQDLEAGLALYRSQMGPAKATNSGWFGSKAALAGAA